MTVRYDLPLPPHTDYLFSELVKVCGNPIKAIMEYIDKWYETEKEKKREEEEFRKKCLADWVKENT